MPRGRLQCLQLSGTLHLQPTTTGQNALLANHSSVQCACILQIHAEFVSVSLEAGALHENRQTQIACLHAAPASPRLIMLKSQLVKLAGCRGFRVTHWQLAAAAWHFCWQAWRAQLQELLWQQGGNAP